MARTVIHWSWEEAFDKFGFEDGDGANFTHEVSDFIEGKFPHLAVECDTWGIHNFMIMDIKDTETGKTVYKINPALPDAVEAHDRWSIGYDDPVKYLPDGIVKALNAKFNDKPKRKKKGKTNA